MLIKKAFYLRIVVRILGQMRGNNGKFRKEYNRQSVGIVCSLSLTILIIRNTTVPLEGLARELHGIETIAI